MGKARIILTSIFLGLFSLKILATPLVVVSAAESQAQTRSFISDHKEEVRISRSSWAVQTGFGARGEGKDEAFASILGVDAAFELRFADWLKLEASPYVRYFSSRVQERFNDDTYGDRLGLNYGHITLSPLTGLEIRAGAVAQFHLNNSQMISSFRSFPGALLEYKTLMGNGFLGGVRGQYVIPTSASLNTQRQDKEELPLFNTQSLFLDYSNPSFYVRSQVGRYSWDHLPARIAFVSTRAGNTPGNESLDPEVRFRYQFQGWFGDVEGAYAFDNGLSLGAKFKRFQNRKAPSHLADSQMVSLFGTQGFVNYGLSLEAGSFFAESDATVARYSSSGFGNTNRDGHFVEGRVDFKPFKFFLVAKYARANEINNMPSQDDLTTVSLMVESYEFQF